ncbi:uncharacterized protein LOC128995132 isoform X2 [Macrosteles quadrilineatus]|uniref:uncharacterized protein LOC128995132 isoform X2 n=1 Tax=Macrosteles quadrilineatus TaxID=74068 RepID=UPI0023E23D78|nr:uncharacterized protein LOC128995132 isoform X2 [Macrosteles quadrilineatus]
MRMNSVGGTLDSIHIKDIRPGLKNFSVTFIVLDVGQPVLLKENREGGGDLTSSPFPTSCPSTMRVKMQAESRQETHYWRPNFC